MLKKSIFGITLALIVTACALIFATSAAEPLTLSVASSGGDYTTVEKALAAVETMAKNGEIPEEGVRLVLTGEHTAEKKDALLFGQKTIFFANGKKVPITITGGTLILPGASSNYQVSCANDYAFENLSMGVTDNTCYLFAGSGDVSLTGIDFGSTVTKNLRFFADTNSKNVFGGWTEKSLALYSKDGLFCSSMTLENMRYYDSGAYLATAVGSSSKFSVTIGSKTLTQENLFPSLYLNNMQMGISAARFGSNNVKKCLLSIRGGTYDYLRGLYKPSSNTNTYTGDVTIEIDGVSTSHYVRLFENNNLVGNLSVTLKNLDLSKLSSSNSLIQLFYQNSSVTGSVDVSMENVKASQYQGANFSASNNAFVNGDLTLTAKNCEFISLFHSGISVKPVAGSIANTLTDCKLPYDFHGAGEASSIGNKTNYTGSQATVGNITNILTDCTFTPVPDGSSLFLGSATQCQVAGNITNTLKNVTMDREGTKPEKCYLYAGCNSGTVKYGTISTTMENCLIGPEYYGANNNGTVKNVTNHIDSVDFLGYAHLTGRSPIVTGRVENHIEGNTTCQYYLYCGTSSGTIQNTASLHNFVSGGTYKGFWGGSAGRSAKVYANIYNEISGGTFNVYSDSFFNSFSAGNRNPSHLEGNTTTVIKGGTFQGFVTGGSIPHNDPQNFHDNPGKSKITLAGGTFLHQVLAGSRWGTYAEEELIVDTTDGKEPLDIDFALNAESVLVAGNHDFIVAAPVKTERMTVSGGKLKVYADITTDSFTYLSGPMPTVFDGHLTCKTLSMNGSELGLGAKGKITAEAVTGGEVSLCQEEIWLKQTYFVSPAGTLISARGSEGTYGSFVATNGTVRGKANALEGASLVIDSQVSLRFAFNTEFVEEIGDNFSFTATIGSQTISQAKRSDLTKVNLGENSYYTVLSQPILAGNLGMEIKVSGEGIHAKPMTPVSLAAAGITVYDKVSQSPELGNLYRAFANYATACHNTAHSENLPLPYPSLSKETGKATAKGPLYDSDIPNAESKDSRVSFTGRQIVLGDDIRIRYTGKITSTILQNYLDPIKLSNLKIICNAKDITTSCNLTQTSSSNTSKTFTFEIPVSPNQGSGDLRIIVRRGDYLCHDYVERADCLAEELKAANSSSAQLADSVLYYLQASKEYYLSFPLLDQVTYPEGYAAGYGREDMSPYGTKILQNSGTYGYEVVDPIYVTCTALWDGEDIALLYTIDNRQCPATLTTKGKKLLEEELGINGDNVFFNASHNHNSPTTTVPNDPTVKPWLEEIYYPAVVNAAKKALLDLAPITQTYHSNADTPQGSNFVRRYLLKDGKWSGIHNYNNATTNNPVVDYETEADKNLRVIYFEREGAKDILWANWQGHAAHAAGDPANKVTADFINYLRAKVEENLDVHFAYFNGASGNINFTSKLKKTENGVTYLLDKNGDYLRDENGNKVVKYKSFVEIATDALYPTVVKALEGKKPLALGKIQSLFVPYVADYRIDDPEKIEKAYVAYDNEYYHGIEASKREAEGLAPCADCTAKGVYHGAKDKAALCQTYGFGSFYEVSVIVSLDKTKKANPTQTTYEITLWVFSCGELGMFFAPYEMFDSDAIEVREASPFTMTFSCGYTNGTYSYMPDDDVYDHGGYEVYTCKYAKGTSTNCNKNMIEGLRTLYNNQK